MESNSKAYWEQIYSSKESSELSWFQQADLTSITIIDQFEVSPYAKIIDIGGGDSLFANNLLMKGFSDVSVLDISGTALTKAAHRIGDMATRIQWIETDINEFNPKGSYDLWHDRATFHFLKQEEVNRYYNMLVKAISPGGLVLIAAFSDKGPDTCSGLPVTRYSKESFTSLFEPDFDRMYCAYEDHLTPGGKVQNFIFCMFKKRESLKAIMHNDSPDGYFNRSEIKEGQNLSCDVDNKDCK